MKHKKIDGGYVVLPKNTLRCNAWKDLDHCGKIVYWAILTEFIRNKKTNPDNKVKITQSQIRAITGQSRQTVVNGIKVLKRNDFLHVKQNDRGGLERNYTTYTLNGRFLW